jgi:hypothetical protein
MTTRQAGDNYTTAVLRVYGVDPAEHRPGQGRPRNGFLPEPYPPHSSSPPP